MDFTPNPKTILKHHPSPRGRCDGPPSPWPTKLGSSRLARWTLALLSTNQGGLPLWTPTPPRSPLLVASSGRPSAPAPSLPSRVSGTRQEALEPRNDRRSVPEPSLPLRLEALGDEGEVESVRTLDPSPRPPRPCGWVGLGGGPWVGNSRGGVHVRLVGSLGGSNIDKRQAGTMRSTNGRSDSSASDGMGRGEGWAGRTSV